MKVKRGGKRKATNPELNGTAEANDGIRNQENRDYGLIDVIVEHQGTQEQKKVDERDGEENNNNEYEEEEEEEEEEDDEEGEEEGQDPVPQEEEEERTNLDEGFFEIEAIRRKRVRKGQLQYLIKWRGWPENANTWEPLENLQSCSDVIDAFEESLRSGKSSRKRKRKGGGSSSLPKKKQSRSFSSSDNATSGVGQYLLTDPLISTTFVDLIDHSASTQSVGSGHVGDNNRNINYLRTAKRTNENRFTNGSNQIYGRSEETDYDPKLSELKGMISANNEANADKHVLHFQEAKVSEDNGLTNGLSKIDQVEPVHIVPRIGSRRRKPSSVKRFKQELASSMLVTEDSTPSIAVGFDSVDEQLGIGNSSHVSKREGPLHTSAIVSILKPIDFSASVLDDMQDVVVTFMAVRSDGKEVMVDNKYLKANNPLLLINFYEQHLKYSTQ